MAGQSTIVPGDLLWAKIGNYPFWPSMVSYDPRNGCYWKQRKTRGGNSKREYHIQFFGEAVNHGWTSTVFLFDGAGELEFKEKKAKLLHEADGKSRKEIKVMFHVPESQKISWNKAIIDAMVAYNVKPVKHRFKTFVFLFKEDDKKAKNKTAPISCAIPQLSLQQESDQPKVKKAKKKNSDDSLELPPGKRAKLNDGKHTSKKEKKKKKLSSDEDFNDVCNFCEMGMVDFSCSGKCQESYHSECLGLLFVPNDFKCPECSLGYNLCFICKKSDGFIKKCNHKKCKKFYHDECLNKYCYTRLRSNTLEKTCGLHFCLTCYKENKENTVSSEGRFLRCLRCPTAFHDREICIAAGSKYLSEKTILCPDHFKKSGKSTSFLNITKCIMCEEGGELICCETCPQAYHRDCLSTSVPDGDFFCDDCASRRPFPYKMIVLGKTGKFRFWPAMIVSPDEIPENVKTVQHSDGEFVIKYFGTNDYAWSHKGRLLPYSEGSKNNIRVCKKRKLDVQYQKSFEDADIAFRSYQDERYSLNYKPEYYKVIRVNKAVPPATISYSKPDVEPCNCNINNTSCDVESACVNRSINTECVNAICTAVGVCQNRKFQKREYAELKTIKTVNRGWGTATKEKIEQGQFIIEYIGEVITHEEYQRRYKDMRERNKKNFYFLQLDSKRIIDAGPCGNQSRFINHSCEPNCELQKWNVNGELRVGIFALVDLNPGDELLFNYDASTFEFKNNCRCGSKFCCRYANPSNESKKPKKKSALSKITVKTSNIAALISSWKVLVVSLESISATKISDYVSSRGVPVVSLQKMSSEEISKSLRSTSNVESSSSSTNLELLDSQYLKGNGIEKAKIKCMNKIHHKGKSNEREKNVSRQLVSSSRSSSSAGFTNTKKEDYITLSCERIEINTENEPSEVYSATKIFTETDMVSNSPSQNSLFTKTLSQNTLEIYNESIYFNAEDNIFNTENIVEDNTLSIDSEEELECLSVIKDAFKFEKLPLMNSDEVEEIISKLEKENSGCYNAPFRSEEAQEYLCRDNDALDSLIDDSSEVNSEPENKDDTTLDCISLINESCEALKETGCNFTDEENNLRSSEVDTEPEPPNDMQSKFSIMWRYVSDTFRDHEKKIFEPSLQFNTGTQNTLYIEEPTRSVKICFKCERPEATLQCTKKYCLQYYHPSCISDPVQNKDEFVCHLHRNIDASYMLRKL